MIWLVRVCVLPGMPAFWAPAGPQPRGLTVGRARAPEAPERAAQKEQPETQMQQNTVNSSVLWLGSRARQKAAAQRASQPQKSKTDRTTAQRSAQQFLAVFTAFCRARTQHRRHARQLGAKMRKNEPRQGSRGFLEGNLDDADQAPLKHHPGPTPDNDVSHIHGLNPAYTRCSARIFHRQAKPQARAGDAEVPDLGNASRPSDECRRRTGAAPIAG